MFSSVAVTEHLRIFECVLDNGVGLEIVTLE